MTDDQVLDFKTTLRDWLKEDPTRRKLVAEQCGVSKSIVSQWTSNSRRKIKKNGIATPGAWYMPNQSRREKIQVMINASVL